MKIGENISGALFSEDGRHRLSLWRIWERKWGKLLFIGLNPSTANHIKDDPTIRRLAGFAKSWGYGGIFVGNLFSIVTSDPGRLTFIVTPETIKEEARNDEAIKKMRKLSAFVLVGWGEWGSKAWPRTEEILRLVGEPVYCLKVNQSGEPAHPLYLPGHTKFKRYYQGGS